MVTVTEDLDLPNGTGIGAVVEITLWSAATWEPVLGYHVPTGKTVVGSQRIATDENGVWSAELLANDEIEPAGTVWHVTRRIDGCTEFTSLLSVPATGGPYTVHDVTVTQPTVVALTGTGGNIPLVMVYDVDLDAYVWPTGIAPTGPFASIIFMGPEDPHTTAGGRTHENDIWLNLT